jgi:hypothetical protein
MASDKEFGEYIAANKAGASDLVIGLLTQPMLRPWRGARQEQRIGPMNGHRPADAPVLRTLVPFANEERISVSEAAGIAGKAERTIRNWCVDHGIGRRVAGGTWAVSKVALAMLLDGDLEALAAYRDRGARGSSEPVASYYRRCELASLLGRPGFAA